MLFVQNRLKLQSTDIFMHFILYGAVKFTMKSNNFCFKKLKIFKVLNFAYGTKYSHFLVNILVSGMVDEMSSCNNELQ